MCPLIIQRLNTKRKIQISLNSRFRTLQHKTHLEMFVLDSEEGIDFLM